MIDARAFRFYATLLVVALLGVFAQSSFTGQEVAGPLLKSYIANIPPPPIESFREVE